MKPERIAGFWWLPTAPERRVAGTLTYDGQGFPELALMETLSDDARPIQGATVLGLTSEAQEVTVEVDFETRREQHSTAKGHYVERQTLAVRRAIVGVHAPEARDRQFTHLMVEFTDLLPWTGWRGPEDSWTVESITVRYTPPAELSADLAWGQLRLSSSYRVEGDKVSSRSIIVGAGIVCERARPAIVETWLDEVVRPLRDFLTIATDRANQVEAVTLWSGDGTQRTRLIYAPTSVELPPRVAYWFEFPFTASSIANEFSDRLARWLEVHVELGPALDLYLSTQYRPSMHLENRFLNMAGAAEAYHRRRFPPTQEARDRHAARVGRILDAVGDKKDRGWLEYELRYAYELSLADRVSELASRTQDVLGPWIGDLAAFAKHVSNARNGLIHRDPDAPTMVPDGRTLLDLMEDLALVFLVCMFQDLGFANAQIRVMLEHTRRWEFLKFRKRGWSD